MKKINKSSPPNALTGYCDLNPGNTWDDFRNYNSGDDYKKIKYLIFSEQGELCAYCEKSLFDALQNHKRIEHYHSKSDNSDLSQNWHLDWNNVIGVCRGGEDEAAKHPLPENLSCDAYKARLENKHSRSTQWEGHVLNPLKIIATPCLFDFDKATGELKADPEGCLSYMPEYNHYQTVEELVIKTIEVFNLNCDRLNKERLLIFRDYLRYIKTARKTGNDQIYEQLAERWFGNQNKWPDFFTTRRILLGDKAEKFLTAVGYDG